MTAGVPRFARRLVTASLAPDERAAVLGDLEEEFADRAGTAPRGARRWYRRQAMRSVGPNLVRRVKNDRQARFALWTLGYAGLAGMSNAQQHHDWSLIWYCPIGLFTALLVWKLPRPRLKTRVQSRLLVWLVTVVIVPTTTVGAGGSPDSRHFLTTFVLLPAIALFTIVRFWPRWPATAEPAVKPPDEFLARWRPDAGDDPSGWLTIGVPNAPCGASGLVFARATGTPRPWVRTAEPTIARSFAPTDTLAIAAAVRGGGAPPVVRLDLLDAGGVIVRTATPVVTRDAFALLPARGLDLVADADRHVDGIAATLPLGGLAPGRYLVSLTIVGAAATAHRDETIAIAPGCASTGDGAVAADRPTHAHRSPGSERWPRLPCC